MVHVWSSSRILSRLHDNFVSPIPQWLCTRHLFCLFVRHRCRPNQHCSSLWTMLNLAAQSATRTIDVRLLCGRETLFGALSGWPVVIPRRLDTMTWIVICLFRYSPVTILQLSLSGREYIMSCRHLATHRQIDTLRQLLRKQSTCLYRRLEMGILTVNHSTEVF